MSNYFYAKVIMPFFKEKDKNKINKKIIPLKTRENYKRETQFFPD